MKLKTLFAAAALVAPSFALAAEYDIDPAHSAASFSVRHLMVSNVRGELGKVSGSLDLDEKDVTRSSVQATIDVNSLDTREAKRDEHLKSADFFDVAKFPTATFKSTRVEKAGKGALKVTGDLTLHGVTRPVVLNVEGPSAEAKDPWGNTKRGFSATTRLDRKDFGLGWNKALETGGVLVGDEVAVTLDLQLVKKAAAQAQK